MPTIRVRFQRGVFVPEEPVDMPDGQAGVVTVEEREQRETVETEEQAWQHLLALIERCSVHTGIPDLAEYHDHYLYGTSREEAGR